VYLDTTYCNPRYCFPAQQESIEYVAGTIQRMLAEDAGGGEQAQEQGVEQEQGQKQQQGQEQLQQSQAGPFRRVYLISTYGIGKERILTGGPPNNICLPGTLPLLLLRAVTPPATIVCCCLLLWISFACLMPAPPPVPACTPCLQLCTTAAACSCMWQTASTPSCSSSTCQVSRRRRQCCRRHCCRRQREQAVMGHSHVGCRAQELSALLSRL
jgi:hypothetical protein